MILVIRPGQFWFLDFEDKKMEVKVKLRPQKVGTKTVLVIFSSIGSEYPRYTSTHWSGLPVGYIEKRRSHSQAIKF